MIRIYFQNILSPLNKASSENISQIIPNECILGRFFTFHIYFVLILNISIEGIAFILLKQSEMNECLNICSQYNSHNSVQCLLFVQRTHNDLLKRNILESNLSFLRNTVGLVQKTTAPPNDFVLFFIVFVCSDFLTNIGCSPCGKKL